MRFLPLLSILTICLLAGNTLLPISAQAQVPSRSQWATLADWSDIGPRLAEAERMVPVNLSKETLVDRLVLVKAEEPGSSSTVPALPDTFVGEVKTGLLVYPRGFLCFLLKNGVRVSLAPLVTEADSSLNSKHPRGYREGLTYADCRAVFVPRTAQIIVASHYYRKGTLTLNKYPAAGVQHELCHAIDFFLGRPSLTSVFKDTYRLDKEQVSVADQTPLRYYLQDGDGGPIETFGQLLAYKYSHVQEHRTLALVRCFPDCLKQIDRFFPAN